MQGSGTIELDERGRPCFRPFVPAFPSMDAVWQPHDRAVQAVAAFDRALTAFPVAGVVGRLFARLDAVHSSGAEGSTTTFSDLLEFESALHRAPDPEDAEAVAACAEAFDALATADLASPSQAALTIHRRLFERARDPLYADMAGQWKALANATFDAETGTVFHYTRPASVRAAMEEWERFTLAAEPERSEYVRQALSHWMFEHIHPVPDGNGRVGRLLVPLLLRQKGATAQACAFMGEATHLDKAIYVEALKHARRTGDMTGWVRVCLAMIAETATANLARLDALGGVLEGWKSAIRGVRSNSVVHPLLPWMLGRPRFTVTDAVAAMGQSFASVNNAVARLTALGLISQAGSAGKDRLFEAKSVLRLFEAPASLGVTPR
jgi:Fic family protein